MNYYWWQDSKGHVGNVYGKNILDAKEKVERAFSCEVVKMELLDANVENRFKEVNKR